MEEWCSQVFPWSDISPSGNAGGAGDSGGGGVCVGQRWADGGGCGGRASWIVVPYWVVGEENKLMGLVKWC